MKIKVKFVLSIDWEGNSLLKDNLKAMNEFNKKYPHIPKVHFLNPAYYTNLSQEFSKSELTKWIRYAIGENDELGLHIHPWKSFVKASRVQYKNSPSYISGHDSIALGDFLGGDIPLTAYNETEMRKLIQSGLKILKENGFEQIKYFRGGGWVSSPKVWEILANEGIFYESSAVCPKFIAHRYPDTMLEVLAKTSWPFITQSSIPYKLTNNLTEFPNNYCLADYLSADEAFELLQNDLSRPQEKSYYLHYGWHQETAYKTIPFTTPTEEKFRYTHYLFQVEELIKKVEEFCAKRGYQLSYPKLDQTYT